MRQIFLDTETTGLSPESGDRIIEIGCVELVNRRLSGHDKHFYLNPERLNSEDAYKIHGLSDDFLADKPLFAAIADDLLAYLDGAEVVIHNAAFDVGFLNLELQRLGRPPITAHVHEITDSLQMAREIYPGKANSLDALCKRLEVDNAHRTVHGALLDAGLLAEVYLRMTRGQNTLGIDLGHAGGVALTVADIDLSQFELPVLLASADELAAHEAVLDALDQASGGRTLWRMPVP
jgi:DNA polymerase III subunit epsilon